MKIDGVLGWQRSFIPFVIVSLLSSINLAYELTATNAAYLALKKTLESTIVKL